MAKRKTWERNGVQIKDDTIHLICGECGTNKNIKMKGRTLEESLDADASGWYTMNDGVAMCPADTIKSGTHLSPLNVLSETIWGNPEERTEQYDKYLNRTRRRMERLSWTSETSDDSTT